MQVKQITRFSNNGKTFFFNQGTSKTGSDFLAINTLYGKGNQERLILFPSHMLDFNKHLGIAIEAVAGITFAKPTVETKPDPALATLHIPAKCKCGAGPALWSVQIETPNWIIMCNHCMAVILEAAL